MAVTIDGSQTLADQESAIQFKEAKGYALKSLAADTANPPENDAEFDKLPIGNRPSRIHLTVGALPAGKNKTCSGNIYVEGNLADVIAYRD